ncbi:MAG: mannose-1-phosphate guanylyltransferase [Deltaproteobacteria bacterium]|nr:mannose-1-phosphate guanylyltransferase [Deltaproteobacteria bacterium]
MHAVILAGGKGTRFWPKSRAHRPKQLLPIVGDRTMVQETVERLAPLVSPDRVWVVTGADHAEQLREQLPGVPAAQVVVEPLGRNTAPAIGLAAELIARVDPQATMIVLPADHHIRYPDRFRDVLSRAIDLAASGDWLVTIGIEPNAPETGYGYVERGEEIDAGRYRVRRFTEKPDRTRAEEFVRSGGYLWNAGIFVWRVRAIRDALRRLMPETAARLGEAVAARGDRARFAAAYQAIEDRSIDYGILEKADNVAVVAGDFGWDDIGSWSALLRLGPADAGGNVVRGRVLALSSRGNLVASEKRLIALVGVEGLVVIDTEDAVLVCSADRVQDVKQVIDELQRRGWKEHL